jgi:hypothetical protein
MMKLNTTLLAFIFISAASYGDNIFIDKGHHMLCASLAVTSEWHKAKNNHYEYFYGSSPDDFGMQVGYVNGYIAATKRLTSVNGGKSDKDIARILYTEWLCGDLFKYPPPQP